MSFSKVDFSKLGNALVGIGKKALASNTKLIASHGFVSIADAGVRLVNGQFGNFLAVETPDGNFGIGIAKGAPKGASLFEIREYEALEDIVEMEQDADGKWIAKEGGRTMYKKGEHYMRAIAVVEEEE